MSHSSKAMRKRLQQLLSGHRSAAELLKHFQSPLPEEPAETPHQILMQQLPILKSRYPSAFAKMLYGQAGFSFSLTGLYPAMITGRCQYGEQDYRLFISTDNEELPAACTCQQSQGTRPCPHTFLFIDWLQSTLKSTHYADRINQDKFDRNPPSMESFRPDPLEKHRRELERLAQQMQSLGTVNYGLPDSLGVAAPDEGRIAWNFVVHDDSVKVDAVYQTPRKRGQGWTKGKSVDLDDLRDKRDLFSAADQRVFDKISNSVRYYSMRSILDPIDAACELIGESNVLLLGEPATVLQYNPEVTFHDEGEHCYLQVGQDEVLELTSEGILEADLDQGIIRVCRLDASQFQCLNWLLKLPPMPRALSDHLIQIALMAQRYVTVRLPDDLAGQQIPDHGKALLLLKLDSKAQLHFGLRIRLSSGSIVAPGQGPLVRIENQNGKNVQLIRDLQHELELADHYCSKLEIPASPNPGSLQGLDCIMEFMQRLRDLESQASELEILWDKESEKPIRMLGSVSASTLKVSVNKSRDWLQLSGECVFGDTKMDLSVLLKSLSNLPAGSIQGNYVRLGDHGWAKISETLRKHLTQLHDSVNEDRKNLVFDASSAKVVQALSTQQIEVTGTSAWTQCLERLDRAKALQPELPSGLKAKLRDYQLDGFKWMRRLAEWGVGGVLADDMGLGKTLQTLAVLLDRSSLGPTLVIAPTSVGFNWVREAEKFAPELKPYLYRETDRNDFLSNVGPGDLVVSSYGLILRDIDKLKKMEWGTLVLDEAQAVKNARSKTASAISELKADWKVALTGTPVENHLGELWSLFHAISPGVFGGWEQFRNRFAGPIERDDDQDRRLALRERIRPFVLRRTKSEVLKDLPARTETNLYIDLSAAEREAYNRVRLSAIGEIDQIAKLSDIKDQRFKMLALLTRLRQLACSPKLVQADWSGRSSKLQQLAETLLELRSEGHRTLVFSQFVTHLQLIQQMLIEEGISFQYLDGSTSPKERQQRVDRFQEGQDDVFLISLKAGGTGLNLTAADYVIHTDPWWNPAVEDQATDRAHRIGQIKPVMVYRLISKGTIEEEILKLHDSKRDLVAGILEGSATAAKLSTEDLLQLIRGDS